MAKLGNSDAVRVGDYVLAIGNPLGLGQTVTMGIVSAKNRTLDGQLVDYADFIQTDAAINQGNSGGPLFNFAGDVIGINSAILNPARAMNVGFAIPINLAKDIAEQIQRNGRVGRGYLGISTVPLTPELARQLGMEFEPGALVNIVEKGGPADPAGVRPNDLVVEIAGPAHRIGARAHPGGDVAPARARRFPIVVVRGAPAPDRAGQADRERAPAPRRRAGHERAAADRARGRRSRSAGRAPACACSASIRAARSAARCSKGDIVVMIAAPARTPATVGTLRQFEERVRRGGRGQLIILRDGEPFALNF